MTIFGWDASDFDWPRGPMDMVAAHNAGVQFFTHKATENTNVKHIRYGTVLNRARAAGIPILGAYHVVRSPATPTHAAAEVDFFLAYVNQQTPWWKDHPHWFWQVDLEKWPYDPVAAAEGVYFAREVQRRTGRKAIIYASKGQYGNELTGSGFELWNANYGSNPSAEFKVAYAQRGGDGGPGWLTYSGKMPVLWQYGSRTTIGRQVMCDANAYRGTLDQLMELLGGDVTPEQVWNYPLPFTQPDGTVETPTAAGVVLRYALYRAYRAEQLTNGLKADVASLQAEVEELKATGGVQIGEEHLDAIATQIAGKLRDHMSGTIALSGTYTPAEPIEPTEPTA